MPFAGNESNHTMDGLTVRGGLAVGVNGPFISEGDVFGPYSGNARAGGIETLPRISMTAQAHATQQLRLSWFTSPVTRIITTMAFTPLTTGASGVTLIRYGLYRLEGDNTITLVASTPNDTALMPTTNVESPKALSTAFTLLAGVRYGAGILQVATTPATPLGLATQGAFISTLPIISSVVTGQSDLPATVAAASNAANAINTYCFLS